LILEASKKMSLAELGMMRAPEDKVMASAVSPLNKFVSKRMIEPGVLTFSLIIWRRVFGPSFALLVTVVMGPILMAPIVGGPVNSKPRWSMRVVLGCSVRMAGESARGCIV